MQPTLKSCPFCGADKPQVVRAYESWQVICRMCGGEVDMLYDRQQAIEAWNRRSHGTCRDCKYLYVVGGLHNCELCMDMDSLEFYCAKWEAKDEQP